MKKKLKEIHEDVRADHYDKGYRYNPFQRYWHTTRINEIRKFLPMHLGKVLDVGCHSGFITEQIILNSPTDELHGIDISREAIKLAKKRLQQGNFLVGDAHELPYKTNYFDAVFCLEALEHVEQPSVVIKEMKRVLKKEGELYILVPTDTVLFRSIWTIWNIVYPAWRHTHIQSFQANRLVDLLLENKFSIERVKRFNADMLLLVKARKT